MIERIIVSRSAGVAAVALDLAIKLGFDHGGWAPADVAVPEKYRLERFPDDRSAAIVEKAVAAADGALFFVQGGDPTTACRQIRRTARQQGRPLMAVDLDRQTGFMASRQIAEWVIAHRIHSLYVDGACDDEAEAACSGSVANILEASLFLAMMETGVASPLQSVAADTRRPRVAVPPQDIEAALDFLENTLSLKDRATIANMAVGELASLNVTLGDYINRNFDLYLEGSALLTDCRRRSGQWTLAPEAAAAFIVRRLWERLRDTHRIRIIK